MHSSYATYCTRELTLHASNVTRKVHRTTYSSSPWALRTANVEEASSLVPDWFLQSYIQRKWFLQQKRDSGGSLPGRVLSSMAHNHTMRITWGTLLISSLVNWGLGCNVSELSQDFCLPPHFLWNPSSAQTLVSELQGPYPVSCFLVSCPSLRASASISFSILFNFSS